MPRRRMMDPSFFDDTHVARLTRDERLFLLGCIRNSDDEGRLKAHPAYLKAEIFMYDEDIDLEKMTQIRDATLEKMKGWPKDNLWRMILYQSSDDVSFTFPIGFSSRSHPTLHHQSYLLRLRFQEKLQRASEKLLSLSRKVREKLQKSSRVPPP